MNKKELVEKVHENLENFTKADSKLVVDAVLDTISEGLAEGEDVKLARFGNFEVVHKEARTARNPSTGEPVDVPAKNVVKFKPSKNLKEVVNE